MPDLASQHPNAPGPRGARGIRSFAFLALLALAACTAPGSGDGAGGDDDATGGKGDSSVDAVVLNFRFKSEFMVNTTGSRMVFSQIEEHLFYTIGHLNGDRSVGRLDQLEVLSESRTAMNGRWLVKYEARLPVAWGKPRSIPETYDFVLPRDVSLEGFRAFTDKYKRSCVEEGAHDVDVDSMWYYYRPEVPGCELADSDVVRSTARVTKSRVNTTGKYPEYHKVWEDGELRVVSIYGKDNPKATTQADAGIYTYNGFARTMRDRYEGFITSSTPARIPDRPGVNMPDVEIHAEFPDGRKVTVNALLVDEVSSAPQSFLDRYAKLAERADLILYNGHSGLGANIQTLAYNGEWAPGQYAIVYMNGCDTYAYVDSALWDAHAAVNDDDPEGTKYLDIMMNVLPAPFGTEEDPTPILIEKLFDREHPKSYEQIFRSILREPVVIVSGEHDNEFTPEDFPL